MTKMTHAQAGLLGAVKTHQIQLEKMRLRIEEYNRSPMLCKNCSSPLSYKEKIRKKVFCTHSCSAIYSNTHRKKDRPTCIVCNTVCKTMKAKYCSNACQQKLKRKINIESGTASFVTVKSYLLALDRRCSSCGLTKWLGNPIMLIGDHIDGNSDNNSIENIRLVCSNCDATLPTYKARNKNSGRAYRRERYAAGLSY